MTLPSFKLERYFARYEFSAQHLLSSSDCEAMTVADLLAHEPGAAEAFQEQWLGYTESQGDPTLRDVIAAIYDGIGPDHVLVHSGAEEAIFGFMNVALGPGDHVIVQTPCYQSLKEVARHMGATVTDWPADPARDWAFDPGFLESAVQGNTKAIVINTPHNPTGTLMPRGDLEAVVETARRHGLALFADEVYRELEHDPADRLPAVCDLYEKAVSLGVLSKTYGLAGLRIGWIATRDKALYGAMAGFKDYLTICNSAPSEFLARIALKHRSALADRNRKIVLDNLDLLDGFFARHEGRFHWKRPIAGPIAFPELKGGGSEAFCHDLVTQAGVLLVPSRIYDAGDRHFRIGFGRRSLPQALARLEQHLSGDQVRESRAG